MISRFPPCNLATSVSPAMIKSLRLTPPSPPNPDPIAALPISVDQHIFQKIDSNELMTKSTHTTPYHTILFGIIRSIKFSMVWGGQLSSLHPSS